MSIRLSDAVWPLTLSHLDKLLMLAFARYANDEGLAWPATSSLARRCGASERSIASHVDSLEKAGLLAVRGFVQRRGTQWQVYDDRPYTPGRARLKLFRVLPGFDLGAGGEKGASAAPLTEDRVQDVQANKGASAAPFSGVRVQDSEIKPAAAAAPNSPWIHDPPARAPARARAHAREVEPAAPAVGSKGGGAPVPLDTQTVLESLPTGLAAVLRRNLGDGSAAAAPSSSEPAARDPEAPEPPQR